MIQYNWPIVLCVALVMCFQINLFFNSVLDKSTRKPNRWVYFILLMALDIVYLTVYIHSVVSSILGLVMIFTLAQAYRVELKTKIIYTLIYVVLMTIVNFISLYLIYAMDSIDLSVIDPDSVPAQDKLSFTKAALLSCIIMFAVILTIRLIAKRRSFSIHYRYYVIFLFVLAISIYQLNVLTIYGERNVHYFIAIVGILLINLGIVYVFDHIVEKFQFMQKNEQLQHQMDYQDANYEKTVHSFKSIKRIIHDTNQQFLYIDECINRNELAAAREHIKVTLNKIEGAYHRVNTGNLAIDALVTNTLNIGQANGIRIDTRLSLSSQEIPIDRYDLCVALGNMLDNAIEASKKVKIAEDRYILIKIRSDESALFIHILNHMENDVVQLQSNKPNPDFHGIGLTNIARICDKYGGNMTIETEHKVFNNMVLLPF